MEHSEQLNELAESLSKFQGEVKDIVKDAQGYGYKYAKLDGSFEVSRPLLVKNGLAVSQPVTGCSIESVTVTTILLHKSGQKIIAPFTVPVISAKGMTILQSIGSSISYARKYGYNAILGLTQVDDDGAGGLIPEDNTDKPVRRMRTHNQPPMPRGVFELLQKRIQAAKISEEVIQKWLDKGGVDSLAALDRDTAIKILSYVGKQIEVVNNDTLHLLNAAIEATATSKEKVQEWVEKDGMTQLSEISQSTAEKFIEELQGIHLKSNE